DVAEGLGLREAGDLGDEPQAPRLAPELAVGHHVEAELLLPADQLDDVLVDVAAFQHLPRAQEAADVLGAVRRLVHRRKSSATGNSASNLDSGVAPPVWRAPVNTSSNSPSGNVRRAPPQKPPMGAVASPNRRAKRRGATAT